MPETFMKMKATCVPDAFCYLCGYLFSAVCLGFFSKIPLNILQ